jgi:hypothetical protein
MTIESGESKETLKIARQSRFRASNLDLICIGCLMASHWIQYGRALLAHSEGMGPKRSGARPK